MLCKYGLPLLNCIINSAFIHYKIGDGTKGKRESKNTKKSRY